jgi:hypothetical protein
LTLGSNVPFNAPAATTPRQPTSRSIPVQTNTGGDPTSIVLQYCASGTDKFYLVTDPSQNFCRCSIRSGSRWPSCASRNYRRDAPGNSSAKKNVKKNVEKNVEKNVKKKPGHNGRAFLLSKCQIANN